MTSRPFLPHERGPSIRSPASDFAPCTTALQLQGLADYRNAVVRSIQDLLGAKLRVSLTNTTGSLSQLGRERYEGEPNWSALAKMRNRARLVWLHLQFTDWGDICVSEGQMKRVNEDTAEFTVYLPATMAALRAQFGDVSKCKVRY
jgi:hypothetical protein